MLYSNGHIISDYSAPNTREEYYDRTFRLVGVTFDNKDGSSRQQLLEDIKMFHGSNGYDYKKGNLRVELVKYKYENEEAIRLEVGIGRDILGNVSREDLPFILENYDFIKEVHYLDVYYGNPYGCTYTVTFKNPNYVPPAPPVEEKPAEEKPIKRTSLFSKLFKNK